jgi:hypothetical protein
MLHKILGTALLSTLLSLGVADAGTVTASIFSPLVPSGTSLVVTKLGGITGPSQATVNGSGYSISFANVGSDQGVVQGDLLPGGHGIPVAGEVGGLAEYYTGGFGSALTTDQNASADYLSTGIGTITITFATPQTSFALLWGSIDAGNSLSFNDASHFTVTGTMAQSAAAGFVGSGFLGPGGSAYVVVDTNTPFTTVTATSSIPSFEFIPLAASTTPLDPPAPEPAGLAMMAGGVLVLAAYRLRATKRLS